VEKQTGNPQVKALPIKEKTILIKPVIG